MNIGEKIINEFQKIGNKYSDIKKICLFGSRARGDHNERSDVDIAVYFFSEPNEKVMQEFEDIETLLKIDVTIMNVKLEQKFLDNVKNEEVVLYMHKIQNKLDNFKKAVEKLEIVVAKPFDDEDLVRDSLVQRFEFCYELAWKTLSEYLKYNGLAVAYMPRAVFKSAYEHSVINNEEVWLSMIKDRNVSSHEYNEDFIMSVVERIKGDYFNEFKSLLDSLEVEVSKLS